MGQCCNCGCCGSKGGEAFNALAPDEKEIDFKYYKSINDKYVLKLETNQNVFTFITLIEFINMLENFSPETATLPFEEPLKSKFSSKDEFLYKNMTIDEFQSFIENKIMKSKDVYEIIGKEQDLKEISLDGMREVYNSLVKKLNQHYKENNPNRILRRNILGMGILYCLSSNIGKIKILFDIFSTDDKFTKSEELDDFLLTLFILSSYAIIAARIKVAKSSNKFKPLSNDELREAIGTSELADCENLLQFFNQNFFDKEDFTYEEFKDKFNDQNNGFGWIFIPQGIRLMLEKHNQ
jgi:hypothetical protein